MKGGGQSSGNGIEGLKGDKRHYKGKKGKVRTKWTAADI